MSSKSGQPKDRSVILAAGIGVVGTITAAIISVVGGLLDDPTGISSDDDTGGSTETAAYLRIDEQWQSCPLALVVPSSISFSQPVKDIIGAILLAQVRGDTDAWGMTPGHAGDRLRDGFVVTADITNTAAASSEQLLLEGPVKVNARRKLDVPAHLNVFEEGQCGDKGENREFDDVALGKSVQLPLPDAKFYTLQSNDLERYEFTFSCAEPGVYSIEIEIPHRFSGKKAFAKLTSPRDVICPESVSILSLPILHERFESAAVKTNYRWTGSSYEATR